MSQARAPGADLAELKKYADFRALRSQFFHGLEPLSGTRAESRGEPVDGVANGGDQARRGAGDQGGILGQDASPTLLDEPLARTWTGEFLADKFESRVVGGGRHLTEAVRAR